MNEYSIKRERERERENEEKISFKRCNISQLHHDHRVE